MYQYAIYVLSQKLLIKFVCVECNGLIIFTLFG